ncbi:MAG: M16 family metallopeptidase [Woeseiaceae bacterium]
MDNNYRRTGFVFLLTCLFAVAPAAQAENDVSTQADIPYQTFQLDNGLTVLVHSDHSIPTVFVGMWYAVGSKDEPDGKTGFAHLFEHLMFQGSENREGEYFTPFTDAGATGMNGTTSQDRTNYYATVPSGALDMALWMESDRMSHLLGAVTQDALDEQRDVVKNEKRQRETRPYAQMSDKIREGLYPVGHPYRHSVIGSMEDLSAASLDDVHEWFNTYYGASNVVLVLAGDVTFDDARAKVAHFFGGVPAGDPLTYPQKWIPELAENREEMMYDRVGVTRISRVWALPGLNDKDTSLMYLVNDSLAGNKNSPLRKKLIDELQLATTVYGRAEGQVLSGEYSLTIDLKPGVTPEQVLSVVDETIAEYLRTGPDPQIVENAKLGVNMYILGVLETGASIGRMLAEGFLYSDDPLFVNQELEWLNAATADELRQVAGRWLTRGYYQLTVEPFPKYSTAESEVDRSTIPAVTASSTINFPGIETAALKNGMQLVVARRGSIPLVDVSIGIDTGGLAAPVDAPGLASFVFGLMDKGTKRFDANELAAAKDKIGMGGRFQDGMEQSSYDFRILRTHLDASLDLAADMLRNPTFPDDELTKYKARISAYLANIEKAPSRAARSLFDRAIYGDDTLMGSVWTPQLLEQVDRAKLGSFHEAEVTPDRITVYMIGDIDIAEATTALNKAFGKWRGQGTTIERAIGDAAEPRSRVILVDYPGAESSTIIGGHAIPPYDAKSWTETSIMNRVIGGAFESRLNMNLREDKGWSYGYYSGIRTNASGDMTFSTSGQVQTDKTAESMQEILREITQFVSTSPATEIEVERVKLNRTRSLPGSFSTNRGFLGSIIRSNNYGLPFDYAETAAERIAAVNVDGVDARARALLDPEKITWLITGDLEKIEESVRALEYGEVEVWDAFGGRLR